MKKALAVVLLLCLTAGVTGCGKLPDPAEALQVTLDDMTKDNALDALVAHALQQDEVLRQYPELQPQYTAALKAYYGAVRYEIVGTVIEEEAGTAVVTVDITEPDAAAVTRALDEWQTGYVAEQVVNETIDYASMYGARYDKLAEIYGDAALEKSVRRAEVPMAYDADTKAWTITDSNGLTAAQ